MKNTSSLAFAPIEVRVGAQMRSVSADGTVRVWDDVAKHYAANHDLTPRQISHTRRTAQLRAAMG